MKLDCSIRTFLCRHFSSSTASLAWHLFTVLLKEDARICPKFARVPLMAHRSCGSCAVRPSSQRAASAWLSRRAHLKKRNAMSRQSISDAQRGVSASCSLVSSVIRISSTSEPSIHTPRGSGDRKAFCSRTQVRKRILCTQTL